MRVVPYEKIESIRQIMKVLVTTPDLKGRGGVGNLLATLRTYLSPDVEYITMGRYPFNGGNAPRLACLARDLWCLHRRLAKTHYDVVHLNPSLRPRAILRDGASLLIAKRFKCKVVVFLHGWDESYEDSIRKRYSRLFRLVYSKSDAFMVLSSRYRNKLLTLGCARRVYLVTTAVGDDIFTRRCHGIGCGTATPIARGFTILFLSRIERSKGIYEAIKAYQLVKSAHPFVRMIIAGDGTELTKVRAYVAEKRIGNVRFVGYVREEAKRRVFEQADVYLFPTYGEGMPVSVLEAMAHGLPVVSRPVGGITDFFEQGNMGFVTDSKNPEAFAALIERLILDPALRHKIGQFNHVYAAKHFMASHLAQRLEDIYREVRSG